MNLRLLHVSLYEAFPTVRVRPRRRQREVDVKRRSAGTALRQSRGSRDLGSHFGIKESLAENAETEKEALKLFSIRGVHALSAARIIFLALLRVLRVLRERYSVVLSSERRA